MIIRPYSYGEVNDGKEVIQTHYRHRLLRSGEAGGYT